MTAAEFKARHPNMSDEQAAFAAGISSGEITGDTVVVDPVTGEQLDEKTGKPLKIPEPT